MQLFPPVELLFVFSPAVGRVSSFPPDQLYLNSDHSFVMSGMSGFNCLEGIPSTLLILFPEFQLQTQVQLKIHVLKSNRPRIYLKCNISVSQTCEAINTRFQVSISLLFVLIPHRSLIKLQKPWFAMVWFTNYLNDWIVVKRNLRFYLQNKQIWVIKFGGVINYYNNKSSRTRVYLFFLIFYRHYVVHYC